jgi:alpha/beta superfamily hydrolase
VSDAEERLVTIACEDLGAGAALEGLFLRARETIRGGAVIAPPHPLYGGSMENPVVSELAFVFARSGLSSLRFNWRGVGASAGSPSGDLQEAAQDYSAALAHLRDTAPGFLVHCGYSFGAAAAVAKLDPSALKAAALLLIAPPPQLLALDRLRAFHGEVLIVAGQLDAMAPPASLQRITEEIPSAKLVALPKVDHFFSVGLRELAHESGAWLREVAVGSQAPPGAPPP